MEPNTQVLIGVSFPHMVRPYYFLSSVIEVKKQQLVLTETHRGQEMGTIEKLPKALLQNEATYHYQKILRIATEQDLNQHAKNKLDEKEAFQFAKGKIKDLHLDMDLITVEYLFDRSKLIFSFVSEERVDFRDLLKTLATRYHTRIELKQVGARDRAKMHGGIGICGLPLCCTTFLNEFDNISISRAKNQMLTLNIPKLTGHCGKLLCCLKYEDDMYSELRAEMPKIGTRYTYNHEIYRIVSMNVLSRMIKLESATRHVEFLPLAVVNQLPRASQNQLGQTDDSKT
jgi:cell fate regulator YaaT (PSP1 superfamily)